MCILLIIVKLLIDSIMSQEQRQSVVELSIGGNNVHIKGSEDFVSEQLSTVLSEVEFNGQAKDISNPSASKDNINSSNTEVDSSDESTEEDAEDHSQLAEVARSIGVEPGELRRYYFVDDKGALHLENPLNMDPKYAFLGYLTIENERTGKQVFDNTGMKETLVSQEGIDIGDKTWGGFIRNARRRGDIRDDPDTDQERNKPFRLTRAGREEFVEWLNEDD